MCYKAEEEEHDFGFDWYRYEANWRRYEFNADWLRCETNQRLFMEARRLRRRAKAHELVRGDR